MKNQAWYVSNAELRDNGLAMYTSVTPETPSAYAGRWACVRGVGLTYYVVSLWNARIHEVDIHLRNLATARSVARSWASVKGDGRKPGTCPDCGAFTYGTRYCVDCATQRAYEGE